MNKHTTLIAVLFCATATLTAQTTATFENISVPAATHYLDNAGASGVFSSGNTELHNYYDAQFFYWEGWAISTVTDNQTVGFGNQYSAITGEGANGSATYAVGYTYSGNAVRLTGAAKGGAVNGVYVTNNTYTYYSMLEGDAFAKKFGGETGNDPDFLKLTIKKSLNGQIGSDSVDFYLADYRFANNANDYILDSWNFVDLRSLGNADSLIFYLSSTDNGDFGMNTPAYFCIDDLITADMTVGTHDFTTQNTASIRLAPNPARDRFWVEWNSPEAVNATLYDLNGHLVQQQLIAPGGNWMDISALPTGVYSLKWENGGLISSTKVVKVK